MEEEGMAIGGVDKAKKTVLHKVPVVNVSVRIAVIVSHINLPFPVTVENAQDAGLP
jgi:hypothetical protein